MRLIDAEALLEKAWDADCRCGYVQVVDVGSIEEAPTVEAKPVVYGKWEVVSNGEDKWVNKCTVCGAYLKRGCKQTNYCPNCGANMLKKEGEQIRLIDAEALKEKITKDEYESAVTQGFAPQLVDTDVFLDYIDNAPTIEAKPVVHARWKPKNYYYICSNCGEDAFWDLDEDLSYPYCPFCGAQMDGKEDE